MTEPTVRECEIMIATANGRTAKDIAREFNLSVRSVFKSKYNLMRKLKIHTSFDLIRYAVENRYVEWNIQPKVMKELAHESDSVDDAVGIAGPRANGGAGNG